MSLDRRAFLAGAGAVILTGCGGEAAGGEQSTTKLNGVVQTGSRAPAGAASDPPHRPTARKPEPRTLQEAIRGRVYPRGAPGYTDAAHVYDPRFDGIRPAAVARPVNAGDVRDAIRFTTEKRVPIRARSGGHSYAGYSTLGGDGIVLDLRLLNRITVDKRAGTATVGAGAQLIDVYAGLAAHGATLPAGSCPSVGISGVTLGGGMGLAARHLGLTLDSLEAATIVTADGALRTVSGRSDPDLLWALRGGGGGNFGIVTEFTFRTHPLPASAAFFNVTWPWSSAHEAISAWQGWAPHATDRITSILHVNSGASISADGQYFGPASELAGLLRPLLTVPGASLGRPFDSPYLPLQVYLAGCSSKQPLAACHTVGSAAGGTLPRNTFRAKSSYVAKPLSAAGVAAMVSAAESTVGSGAMLCDCYGGAINRVAPDATAFVHRDDLFCIQFYGNGASPAWVDQAWGKLHPHVSEMAYQNYIDPALSGWQEAYYGENYARLRSVRRTVDPHHYFNFPQAIG